MILIQNFLNFTYFLYYYCYYFYCQYTYFLNDNITTITIYNNIHKTNNNRVKQFKYLVYNSKQTNNKRNENQTKT